MFYLFIEVQYVKLKIHMKYVESLCKLLKRKVFIAVLM